MMTARCLRTFLLTGGQNFALCFKQTRMAISGNSINQLLTMFARHSHLLRLFLHIHIHLLLGLMVDLAPPPCHPSLFVSPTSTGWLHSALGTLAGTRTLSTRNSKGLCGKVPASRCLARCAFFSHGLCFVGGSYFIKPNLTQDASRFSPACVLKCITRRTLSVSGKSVTMYRLSIDGQHLICQVEEGIAEANGASNSASNLSTESNVWVPLPIVHHALPSMVKKGDKGPALAVS